MTDFVVVIATVAMLASPPPATGASATAASGAPAVAPRAAPAPLNVPTVGFRTYTDAASCEQATAAVAAPAGTRFVCVPVEPANGELASAY